MSLHRTHGPGVNLIVDSLHLDKHFAFDQQRRDRTERQFDSSPRATKLAAWTNNKLMAEGLCHIMLSPLVIELRLYCSRLALTHL